MSRIAKIPWFFLLLTGLPVLLGLGYALLYSLGLLGLLSRGFTLSYWLAVLGDTEFWSALTFSILVALVTIGASTGLALLAVLRWRNHLLEGPRAYAYYMPLALPATVMAFLVFQWLGDAGLLARVAYQVGLIEATTDFPDLINDRWGIGVIAAHVLMATPFLTIFFGNLYRSERVVDLTAVAATLGLASTSTARRLVLPLLLRRGKATLLLYAIFVFSSYEIPLLLGSQSPQMISVLTIRKLQRYNLADIPQAYTIALLYALLLAGGLLLWLGWNRLRAAQTGAHEL